MHHTRHHLKRSVCPHCEANTTTIPFEDVSSNAKWITTIGISKPWTSLPVFSCLPGGDDAAFIRLDTFHLGPLGAGYYLAPSVLFLLIVLQHFHSADTKKTDVESRLTTAHGFFSAFCRALQKTPRDLKDFTKSNMHWPDQASYPMLSCKAGDTTLMLLWLEDYLTSVPLDLSDPVLEFSLDAVRAYNTFWRLLYTSESRVWWTTAEADAGLTALTCFLRSYHAAAKECYARYLGSIYMFHYLYTYTTYKYFRCMLCVLGSEVFYIFCIYIYVYKICIYPTKEVHRNLGAVAYPISTQAFELFQCDPKATFLGASCYQHPPGPMPIQSCSEPVCVRNAYG